MKQCQRWWVCLPAVFIFTIFFLLSEWDLDHDAHATDPKMSSQLIEPCELIPRTEAEEILGEEMKDGLYSENKVVGQKICFYEAADENSFAFLQVSLTQNSFISANVLASGQNAQTIFNSIKEAFPDRQDIEGMGDDAFIATPGIHILKGDYYLTIGVGNINRNKDKLTDAGAKAMANLEVAL
ncbi:MAG: hypothetical protein R6U27_05375 [Desulfobacterales bacterium]